jgi:hypothetical protein
MLETAIAKGTAFVVWIGSIDAVEGTVKNLVRKNVFER